MFYLVSKKNSSKTRGGGGGVRNKHSTVFSWSLKHSHENDKNVSEMASVKNLNRRLNSSN